LPIRSGGGGGGGGPTAISDDITPTSGTPATFGDGQFITDCMFAGWEVSDPNAVLDSMTDDGVTCDFTINNTTAGQKVATDVNNYLVNMLIMHPEVFVGDFHFQIYVANTVGLSGTNELMMTCGGGDLIGEGHNVIHALNANGATNWQQKGVLNTHATHSAFLDFTTHALITHRWFAVQRVSDLITWREGGTAATPVWSDTDSERQDVAGGSLRIGFQAITGLAAGSTYSFKKVLVDGFIYQADLAA
jgi:hypothetical protein